MTQHRPEAMVPRRAAAERPSEHSGSTNTGVTAGSTSISSLGEPADQLVCRGYAITDLAAGATFEEVAFLLLLGSLPTPGEYENQMDRLYEFRELPQDLLAVLHGIPQTGHPLEALDALRTSVSPLGSIEPETRSVDDPGAYVDRAQRLMAIFPMIVLAWHGGAPEEGLVRAVKEERTTAGLILRTIEGYAPSQEALRALDISLILYADLAFNASTYAARVCASTQADHHACITSALATLRGPLHGGASVAVNGLLECYATPDEARRELPPALARRERIMGFGHALYRRMDPRTSILRELARTLAWSTEHRNGLEVAIAIEEIMLAERGLYPNVDFYTAVCYRMLGIPLRLLALIFACARIAGWCAHVAEQREQNHLIHPPARYNGPLHLSLVPLAERIRGTSTFG